jgi:phosphoserine phosphatase
MDEAVAYADNWSDRALLERVGRAVVVHPHRKLRRLAQERGWVIVRPRRPVARPEPTPGD